MAIAAAALALVVPATAQSAAAASRAPRIVLRAPHAWQVVQRGADGLGDIVVSGRCIALDGGVRIGWGGRRATARCGPSGRFSIRLHDIPAGQDTLHVWSTRRPRISCSRVHVGVGDIYVIAGQSNASGRSPYRFAYSSPASNPTLRATMSGNDRRWQELRDPVDSAAGQVDPVGRDLNAGGSVWPGVATVLLREEGVPVAFVPCARSNTRIAAWDPALSRRRPRGTLYTSMARRIAAVGGRVRAVLWWQGERDARFLTPGGAYETALRGLATHVWRDFRAPTVVAQIGDYSDKYTAAGVDVVRLAQARAWGAPHIVQGPALYDVDLHGDVHFREPDDVAVAADRWAAAILRGVLHRDSGTSPRLLLAARQGDEVILTADAPLVADGVLGGFVVSAGGQPVPVVSASAAGDTVRLVLGEPATGTLDVSLGAGRSAAGAAVPTDASAWRLPMLPFFDRPVVAEGG